VENTTGKEFRIATLCVQNNPFWVNVQKGVDSVTATLADPKFNCVVDFIPIADFDAQDFAEAIDTCIVKGYNAITTVGVSDAIWRSWTSCFQVLTAWRFAVLCARSQTFQ
jgi:ribose transport system substrate-binding protein